jgi:hypothetical protein
VNETAKSVLFVKYSNAQRNEITLICCEISWWIRFKECKQWSSRKYNECQIFCRNFKISFFFYFVKNTFVVFFLRASRKIIVDEKLDHSFFSVIMISWNVRSSFVTSMHDRNVLSHIELFNLMCIRCIKRLTTDLRHICVTRVNRKKCRYCAQQRHKCVLVNVHLRVICETLFIFVNASLFLKYDIDAQNRRRSFDDERFDQSSNRSCFSISCALIHSAHWDWETQTLRSRREERNW